MRYVAAFGVLFLVLTAMSCSSGPTAPQPGTPAFYWAAAKTSYAAGDFQKTNDNLAHVLRTDNDYTLRAQAWSVILSAGLTRGLMELADKYDVGAKVNRSNPGGFRRLASACRTLASSTALQSIEIFHAMRSKRTDAQIPLAFEYPAGTPALPVQLDRVTKGILVPDAEADLIQGEMLKRGVLLELARIVGAPDDTAKALQMFKQSNVQVPREMFLYGVAASLYDQAQLYGPKALDQPNRAGILCSEAVAALEGVPQDKNAKDLLGKIRKMQKNFKLM